MKDPSSFLQDASATAFRLVKGKKRAKQPAFKKFLIHITISNRIFLYICNGLFRRKPPGGEGEMFILRRRLQAFVIYVQNFANFDLSE
ncbi:hypothetical protein HMPREF2532_01695 [Bacteroides ovatus]|nr:hypothetical protein HMPREF2532_01695 [Bacteroides ovatus]